jgi:acyl-CoA hydrolase
MSDIYQRIYQSKKMTAADAMGLVENGDLISVPTGVGEPPTLLTALSEQRQRFHGVTVAQILPLRKYAYIRPRDRRQRPPSRLFLWWRESGRWPGRLDRLPAELFLRNAGADQESADSRRRGVHHGFANGRARLFLDQPGHRLHHGGDQRGAGGDSRGQSQRAVHQWQLPRACLADCRPDRERRSGARGGLPQIGKVQEAIGEYVTDIIEDGSTLQIGYGAIPDAVVMQLVNKHDLGIHTEMIGDGILKLLECGAVTNRKKTYLPGKMVATFALGSQQLYRFMHRNPMLEMHPVDYTNDPFLAARNDKLVTINATLQVDLIGQCCSESFGPQSYSGTGGQVDFVRAANRSRDGKSFIVLPATAKGDSISRIVPTLTAGAHVTTSKNDVNYVVTEYGLAQLRGKSAKQRAQALIGIAHPDFRGELTEAARKLNLL